MKFNRIIAMAVALGTSLAAFGQNNAAVEENDYWFGGIGGGLNFGYNGRQYVERNSSGNGIACVSWDGEGYADQFWRHFSFGNVKDRPFSEIWSDTSRTDERSELMFRLKDKKPFVTGRCSKCKWLDVCAGNFRVRAEAATGDLWASDPACYLTDEEIGLA